MSSCRYFFNRFDYDLTLLRCPHAFLRIYTALMVSSDLLSIFPVFFQSCDLRCVFVFAVINSANFPSKTRRTGPQRPNQVQALKLSQNWTLGLDCLVYCFYVMFKASYGLSVVQKKRKTHGIFFLFFMLTEWYVVWYWEFECFFQECVFVPSNFKIVWFL